MSIESDILTFIQSRPYGSTAPELERALAEQSTLPPGVAECVLRVSPQVVWKSGRCFRKPNSKTDAIRLALEAHADATGRFVFRLESALATLPVDLKPTHDELVAALHEINSFEMLRNGMVRKRA